LTQRGAVSEIDALSVGDEPTTTELTAKHGLTLPGRHSADAGVVSAATGAFVDPGGGFLQSTGFVLDPAGNVVVSVYSSGGIGRVVPEDVMGLIRYLREHAETAVTATEHESRLAPRLEVERRTHLDG
jgi:hypothetical protein